MGCRLWMSGTQGRKTVREHKLCQHHHPHLLPVLLMFLKLPKLFNFHILRLAAEREISKRRERGVQVLGKKGRYEIFRERQTRLLIFIHTEEKEQKNKKSQNISKCVLVESKDYKNLSELKNKDFI